MKTRAPKRSGPSGPQRFARSVHTARKSLSDVDRASAQAPGGSRIGAVPAGGLRVRLGARTFQVGVLDALGMRLVARCVVEAVAGLGFFVHAVLRCVRSAA